jgi:hypothetical protein
MLWGIVYQIQQAKYDADVIATTESKSSGSSLDMLQNILLHHAYPKLYRMLDHPPNEEGSCS